MLQGVEPEVGQLGHRLPGRIHPEDTTFILRMIVVAGLGGPKRVGEPGPLSVPGAFRRTRLTELSRLRPTGV